MPNPRRNSDPLKVATGDVEKTSVQSASVSDVLRKMPEEDRNFLEEVTDLLKKSISTKTICEILVLTPAQFEKKYNSLRERYPDLYLEPFEDIFGTVETKEKKEGSLGQTPAQKEMAALRIKLGLGPKQ